MEVVWCSKGSCRQGLAIVRAHEQKASDNSAPLRSDVFCCLLAILSPSSCERHGSPSPVICLQPDHGAESMTICQPHAICRIFWASKHLELKQYTVYKEISPRRHTGASFHALYWLNRGADMRKP